jgi:hypothetical protein
VGNDKSFRGGLGKLSINSSALMVKNPEALQRRVLQPLSAKDPRKPKLTSSQLKILILIL